jgi:CHASE2 domain-containing sensor protein
MTRALIAMVANGGTLLTWFITNLRRRACASAILATCLLFGSSVALTGCHARVHGHHGPAGQISKVFRGR